MCDSGAVKQMLVSKGYNPHYRCVQAKNHDILECSVVVLQSQLEQTRRGDGGDISWKFLPISYRAWEEAHVVYVDVSLWLNVAGH